MTNVETMKQALEALEYYQRRNIQWEDTDEQAITSLRQAIAEAEKQSEPVAWQYRTRPQWGSHLWTVWAECKKEVAEDYLKTPVSHEWEYEVRVLYTTPQQRKPLTDGQIDDVVSSLTVLSDGYIRFSANLRNFARAIEAAHDIKK